MTDQAAAVRPGCAEFRRCRRCIHGHAGLSSAGTGIAACRQRAPGLPRCTRAVVAACPPLSKRPGAHRRWVSFIDGPGPESRLDILAVNVRLIYELLRRGVWTIPFLFYAQGAGRAFPGESPVMGAARQTIPSISPMCTQAWRRFTQVIHMVVHSKPARSSPAGLAGSSGSAYWCLRRRPGTPDARDLTWARTRSPKKAATGCSPHTLQESRPASPSRPPARHAHPDPLRIAPLRYPQAARAESLRRRPPSACATTTRHPVLRASARTVPHGPGCRRGGSRAHCLPPRPPDDLARAVS